MGRLVLAVSCLSFAACAGARNAPATGGSPEQGSFTFTANLPDQQLRGRLRVVGDEILLEPTSGTCRPIQSDSVSIRFGCTGSGRYEHLSIRIDRHRPTEQSTWSAGYRVKRSRENCSEYGIVAGQQVCVRSWTEYYDTIEGKAGRLAVRRSQ
jgi:hypothetical protein